MVTVMSSKIEPNSSEQRQPPAGGNHRPGRLFVLSAPSGAGKSTLCHALRTRYPDLKYSISTTTRRPRPQERQGVDYHFISTDEFERGIQAGRWAEWAEVHGNYYGTSADFLDRELAAGNDILMDIDVQGTMQILKRYPDCITIFIMPPSLESLRKRLHQRGTENERAVGKRMKTAEKEIAQKDRYRHVVVNDELSAAIDELGSLMATYRTPRKETETERKG